MSMKRCQHILTLKAQVGLEALKNIEPLHTTHVTLAKGSG